MVDLVVLDILYHIKKYKDYDQLIKLFETDPEFVIKDKNLHQIMINLAKGGLDKRGGGSKTSKKDAMLKYLVARVYAYQLLGFPLYSTGGDSSKIAKGKPPKSAVDKVCRWYESVRVGDEPYLSYESIRGYTKNENKRNENNPKNKNKYYLWIPFHLIDIYDEEKEGANILKAKANAKGTIIDPEVFPEFWSYLK